MIKQWTVNFDLRETGIYERVAFMPVIVMQARMSSPTIGED